MASRKNRSRKSLAVALAIVGVAGLSMASAAQLNVTSDTVAAGTSVVAACDTDGVSVAYTTGFLTGSYRVTGVTISGIAPACVGRTLDFTLVDSGNASLATGTAPVAGTSVTVGSLTVSAAALTSIAVVIH
jgi:hypothetical protein